MPAVRRAGARPPVQTVEGLRRPDGTLSALQQAFTEHHALQCGFCTPAMLLTAQEFLRDHPAAARTRRSARRSAASPAAAPATSRSSSPSGRSRRRRRDAIEQDPERRQDRRRHGRAASAAPLARQEPQPRRGSALPPRRGPLHRRHQAAGDGARGDRAQPARARAHRRDRHLEGRDAAGRDRASSRARTSPSARRRCRPSAPARSSRT